MSPRVTRATTSGRTYLDLQNLARRNHRPTQEYLHLHALEGFLDRLSTSPQATNFVLKGGVLLAAYDARRPTADVDLSGQKISNDVPTIQRLITQVAQREIDDEVVLDTTEVTAESIRDEETYRGVRVKLRCKIASAQFPFHIDVNVGDPIRPAPVQIRLPRLLGGEITLRGYPLSMVIAEKVVTAVQRGPANTRWRDYADIYLLTTRHMLSGDAVQESVATVSSFRGVSLRRTTDALDGYAEIGQAHWARWRRKHTMEELIPSEFADVLAHVARFCDPAIDRSVSGLTWQPWSRSWS